MPKQKRILITNDDGFESEGLKALCEALKPLGNITVVAPTTEKSACGHSLTLTRPLRFIQIEDDFFKLDNGTPSDCIYLALHALFKEDSMPDLVVSGINKGANLGEDITYSGTVAGAMEGVLQGIPSIAISQTYSKGIEGLINYDFDLAKSTIATIVEKVFKGDFPLPPRKLLNINIPSIKKQDCKGFKITKTGNRLYGYEAQLHRNPRGLEYYWLGTPNLRWIKNGSNDCDLAAIDDGYVSITPIHLDLTAHDEIKNLQAWLDDTK